MQAKLHLSLSHLCQIYIYQNQNVLSNLCLLIVIEKKTLNFIFIQTAQ